MSLSIGKHQCKVLAPVNGWFGEAGAENKPYVRIPLEITAGECKGQKVTYQGWMTPAAIDNTEKRLKEVFDWDGNWEDLSGLNTGPWVGKECEIDCQEEEYNGKTEVRIKWLNRVGGGAKMMTQERTASFLQQLSKRNQPAAQPSRGLPRMSTALDDDLPY